MRFRPSSLVICTILAAAVTAGARQPPERSPDRPPRDEGGPRRDPRPGEDSPPPPGKIKGKAPFEGDRRDDGPPLPGKDGPRPKSDPADKGRKLGGNSGFGGGFSGGYGSGGMLEGGGGYGGMRSRGGPGMMPGGMPGMPGMPGPAFGEGGPPDDPEMRDVMRQDAEMERKTHELSMRVRESRGDERAKLKTELTDHVNKHFEVRQKRRELQLKRMEEELQRLRDAIASRNKSRDSIVTNHIKELIGEERDLEF